MLRPETLNQSTSEFHKYRTHHTNGFLAAKLTLTLTARINVCSKIKTHSNAHALKASYHLGTQQSHQDDLVPFASLSAISGTV